MRVDNNDCISWIQMVKNTKDRWRHSSGIGAFFEPGHRIEVMSVRRDRVILLSISENLYVNTYQ
jgi:hypothetical protein